MWWKQWDKIPWWQKERKKETRKQRKKRKGTEKKEKEKKEKKEKAKEEEKEKKQPNKGGGWIHHVPFFSPLGRWPEHSCGA